MMVNTLTDYPLHHNISAVARHCGVTIYLYATVCFCTSRSNLLARVVSTKVTQSALLSL